MVFAHVVISLANCQMARADFSSANFKRVWAEEFGQDLASSPSAVSSDSQRTLNPTAQMPVASFPNALIPTADIPVTPLPNAVRFDFTSQQPHPAVARIVVPEGDATSFGSGTLVDIRENFGMVITNWHVVRDAKGTIEVIFPGGFASQARAVKVDEDWDLAALVIWRPPIVPVKIAATAPKPRDQLTICGYGPGIYRSVTGRCTQYYAPKENFPHQMVELNVEARQGDSGGPIFNSRGELAGVLFGAGDGTTMGSFAGRVNEFLTSLAPDIGRRSESFVRSTPTVDQLAQQPPEEDSDTSVWQSSPLEFAEQPPARRQTVKQASVALLEPPAFDELNDPESDSVTPLSEATFDQMTTIASVPHAEPPLFDQIKTALAAIGLLSIAVMILKAAG